MKGRLITAAICTAQKKLLTGYCDTFYNTDVRDCLQTSYDTDLLKKKSFLTSGSEIMSS